MISDRARRRFHEVFVPHLEDGYSLARWLTKDATDAEDVVQEAAIRALDALERTDVAQGKAWTLAIVRNTALTWMKRKRPGELTFVGDANDLELLDYTLEASQTAEEAIIAAETGARVRDAIGSLPSPLRETLIMREINDLNYKEIAEATDVPIGTVMSRLARARTAVARALKDAK